MLSPIYSDTIGIHSDVIDKHQKHFDKKHRFVKDDEVEGNEEHKFHRKKGCLLYYNFEEDGATSDENLDGYISPKLFRNPSEDSRHSSSNTKMYQTNNHRSSKHAVHHPLENYMINNEQEEEDVQEVKQDKNKQNKNKGRDPVSNVAYPSKVRAKDDNETSNKMDSTPTATSSHLTRRRTMGMYELHSIYQGDDTEEH